MASLPQTSLTVRLLTLPDVSCCLLVLFWKQGAKKHYLHSRLDDRPWSNSSDLIELPSAHGNVSERHPGMAASNICRVSSSWRSAIPHSWRRDKALLIRFSQVAHVGRHSLGIPATFRVQEVVKGSGHMAYHNKRRSRVHREIMLSSAWWESLWGRRELRTCRWTF